MPLRKVLLFALIKLCAGPCDVLPHICSACYDVSGSTRPHDIRISVVVGAEDTEKRRKRLRTDRIDPNW